MCATSVTVDVRPPARRGSDVPSSTAADEYVCAAAPNALRPLEESWSSRTWDRPEGWSWHSTRAVGFQVCLIRGDTLLSLLEDLRDEAPDSAAAARVTEWLAGYEDALDSLGQPLPYPDGARVAT